VSDSRLDSNVLAALREVMEGEYPVLLDAFLTDSEKRLQRLHIACDNGDVEQLRQAAHSFKGSCGNMGAVQLAELCRQLEELAGDGRLDGAAALIEGVEREFAIARILYRAERQRYAAPD